MSDHFTSLWSKGLKEPIGTRFFIFFRFVICKILSIKVNSSLAPALEAVGVHGFFQLQIWSFSFNVGTNKDKSDWLKPILKWRIIIKTTRSLKDKESPGWVQKKTPQIPHMVFWTKCLRFWMSKIYQKSK